MLETYSLNNGLKDTPGMLKFLFAVLTLLVCALSKPLVLPLIVFSIMMVMSVGPAKIPVKFYFKLLIAPAAFGIMAAIPIMFFHGITPWFSVDWGWITLVATQEGTIMASTSFARMMGSVSCLLFLALTTPIADILSIMNRLRLPVVFIEISMLIYRYIFISMDQALRIERAQRMRLGYSHLRGSLHALALLAGNLFISSWDNGDRMLTSMNARCYTGTFPVIEQGTPIPGRHLLGIVGFELALITLNIVF